MVHTILLKKLTKKVYLLQQHRMIKRLCFLTQQQLLQQVLFVYKTITPSHLIVDILS